MDSDTAQLVLLTDEALGEGNSTDLDGLGFSTYSKVLGDAAVGTPGPFTIGVFGEWGTGKTSLMRLIQSYLDEKENVVTVWFNAWRYEREEHPIVPLVATIIRELERNKTFTAKLAEGGKTLIRSLRAVAYGFSAKSKVKLPGFAEVEASFVAKEMIERDEKLTADPLLDRSLYYEAFERLSALPANKNSRIVVIIDDLDRCFPDLAIRLLESIKLVLAQQGFIFILGVARSVIEGYLQHRYSTEYGIADFEGHSYLDKIVQLPFHIPPHKERMVNFGEKVLKRIAPDFLGEFKDILPIISSASGSNPRATVRFVNNLLIDIAINRSLAESGEMANKIDLAYFAVTRCLQQRWPHIFSILTMSNEICTEMSQWSYEDIRKKKGSDQSNIVRLAGLMETDNDLRDLFFSPQGKNWLENNELRNATIHFLETQRSEPKRKIEASERKYDIYLSYNTEDKEHVSKIVEALIGQGFEPFCDFLIIPGENIELAIQSALRNSRLFALCSGFHNERRNPEGQPTDWREVNFLVEQYVLRAEPLNKGVLVPVIPILLPGGDFKNLPSDLKILQIIDLREGVTLESLAPLFRVLSIHKAK